MTETVRGGCQSVSIHTERLFRDPVTMRLLSLLVLLTLVCATLGTGTDDASRKALEKASDGEKDGEKDDKETVEKSDEKHDKEKGGKNGKKDPKDTKSSGMKLLKYLIDQSFEVFKNGDNSYKLILSENFRMTGSLEERRQLWDDFIYCSSMSDSYVELFKTPILRFEQIMDKAEIDDEYAMDKILLAICFFFTFPLLPEPSRVTASPRDFAIRLAGIKHRGDIDNLAMSIHTVLQFDFETTDNSLRSKLDFGKYNEHDYHTARTQVRGFYYWRYRIVKNTDHYWVEHIRDIYTMMFLRVNEMNDDATDCFYRLSKHYSRIWASEIEDQQKTLTDLHKSSNPAELCKALPRDV